MPVPQLSPNSTSGPIDGFAVWLAQKINGTKTVTGLLLVAGGLCTVFLTPEYKETGVGLIIMGLNLFIVGATHKLLKLEQVNE